MPVGAVRHVIADVDELLVAGACAAGRTAHPSGCAARTRAAGAEPCGRGVPALEVLGDRGAGQVQVARWGSTPATGASGPAWG